MGEGKIRHHFQLPTKLPTLLLHAAVVTQLQRPPADKSGNNFKSPNPVEVNWITFPSGVQLENELQICNPVEVKSTSG
jgi:hypothetical protein